LSDFVVIGSEGERTTDFADWQKLIQHNAAPLQLIHREKQSYPIP
jgi:hypothetical protein